MDWKAKSSKPCLVRWMKNVLEHGTCPGVVWHDKEKNTFRIPWVHYRKSDWNRSLSKVFKEWAMKRHRNGEKEMWPKWKTRLRCALNKGNHIKEIRNLRNVEKKTVGHPYRVYQFLDADDTDKSYQNFTFQIPRRSFGDTSQLDFFENSSTEIESDTSDSTGTSSSTRLHINSSTVPSSNADKRAPNVPTIINEGFDRNCHALGTTESDKLQDSLANFIGERSETILPEQNTECLNIFLLKMTGDVPSSVSEMVSGNDSLPSDLESVNANDLCRISPAIPDLDIDQPEDIVKEMNQFHVEESTANARDSSAKLANDVDFQVYYTTGVCVMSGSVASKGARFCYGSSLVDVVDENTSNGLYGPKDLQLISLPSPKTIQNLNPLQTRKIQSVLENMTRGLILWSDNNNIYVQRFCRARVFSWMDGCSESKIIERCQSTKIFDFTEFRGKMDAYLFDDLDKLPDSSVYLTFAQEVEAGHANAFGSLKFYVVVKHREAERLHEEFLSARFSRDLQISSENSADRLEKECRWKVFGNQIKDD